MQLAIAGTCAAAALALAPLAAGAQPAAAPAAVGGGAVPATAAPRTELEGTLEAKVRAAWSIFKKRDTYAYAQFLTDDFQAVESDGEGERTKTQVLREVEHSQYTDYILQFFKVQPLGADYAFVTYESSMQFPKGSPLRLRRVFIGELWTRHASAQWKMMRYQETLVR